MFSDSDVTASGPMQNPVSSVSSPSVKKGSEQLFTLKWVNSHTVDVFTGQGWENWSRFEKKGSLYRLLAGKPLTPQEYIELKNGR